MEKLSQSFRMAPNVKSNVRVVSQICTVDMERYFAFVAEPIALTPSLFRTRMHYADADPNKKILIERFF
jgi:hypothetical protein